MKHLTTLGIATLMLCAISLVACSNHATRDTASIQQNKDWNAQEQQIKDRKTIGTSANNLK